MAATLKLRRGTPSGSIQQSELFYDKDIETVVVGDGSDADRLFTSDDADMTETYQFHSNYQHIYTANANVTATITQGGASSGVATVTVLVVSENLTVKDYGSIADLGGI